MYPGSSGIRSKSGVNSKARPSVINELFVHGGHGAQGTSGIGRPGDHAPGLRNRVDPAFAASGRAQWRPVVVIAAPIPTSIPTILLKSGLQRSHMGSPVGGVRALIARLGQ